MNPYVKQDLGWRWMVGEVSKLGLRKLLEGGDRQVNFDPDVVY